MKTITINVSPERAQEALRTLQALLPLARQRGRYIHISTSADGDRIDIPRATFNILVQVLQQMSEGHEIAIMPLHAELTTQQAAELLNVSRPYVIGLLDSGVIPSRKVGKHRRVLIKDILAYKQDSEQLRTQQLAELTAEAQRLGLGY